MNTIARRLLIRPAVVARVTSSMQFPNLVAVRSRSLSTRHTEREVQGGLNMNELKGIDEMFSKDPTNATPQTNLSAEQLMVLDQMFGKKLESLENEVRVLRQRMKELDPAFAVDGPDGDSLGHEFEEKLEVNHIIEEAALHEDTKKVEKAHKLEEEVKKFHARDPEHDW